MLLVRQKIVGSFSLLMRLDGLTWPGPGSPLPRSPACLLPALYFHTDPRSLSAMPEIRFQIQWPDGQQETCYSPSLIVQDYFEPGQAYTLTEFLNRSRESLQIASARVQAKYGFPCSLALGQLQKIELTAAQFSDRPEAVVTVVQFV
jgi:uncharacterized repeat protein (TIGR04042 family)